MRPVPIPGQTETGRTVFCCLPDYYRLSQCAIPGVGYMGYFKDTEWNIFGIREMDESAK